MSPRQACLFNNSNGTDLVLCGLCWTAVVALGTPPAADTWSPLNLEQGERFRESQSAEGRYRLLVEGITDYAIYLLDLDGLVTSWNRGAQRFKGYSESEIIGQHFSRFYTEEDKAIDLPRTALRTAREEGRFEQEGWRVRKDGTRFWAHVVIDPIRDFEGNLVGYAKITRDLSERRRAEEQLWQSQEQLRLLVQGVTDYALYMLDLNGRVSSWNTGAERIKGYTRDETWGITSRVSIPRRSVRRGCPAKPCNRRRPRAVGRRKAGACARTVAASGPT
jgi:PAS domain S-box-containing protein